MNFTTIPTSEGRKKLRQIIKEVDETGNIYVFTVNGKAKVAMVDIDLLEEFIENAEFGISGKELAERSKESTISFKDFKKKLNV